MTLARAILTTDWRDPANVLASWADEPWTIAFLSGGEGAFSRWSYLSKQPEGVFRIEAGDAADPFRVMQSAVPGSASASLGFHPDEPPFQGGVAGLACYELGTRVEPAVPSNPSGWPDLAFGQYNAILAFDHEKQRVFSIGRADNHDVARSKADQALGWLTPLGSEASAAYRGSVFAKLTPSGAKDYENAVSDVVDRIWAGEIFQANIARTWRGRLEAPARPLDVLFRLTKDSPAPFAAYFQLGDLAVVSNSPERFVTVRPSEGQFLVEARPIKGTVARGTTPEEDQQYADWLMASVKDRAENVMIVDLMRNDLARVCLPGTVTVPSLCGLETYANVHHLVSSVTGRLRPGLSAIDLMHSAFPPGSITGAPKVQAMKVIAGQEPPRGPYCGAMFWAGYDGAFDSSVLIRTAAFRRTPEGWDVSAGAGAGIVADSLPVSERQETETKISALRRALEGA